MKKTNWSNQLRAWRDARGLDRTQAARKLGISRRTLEGWENGKEPLAILRRTLEKKINVSLVVQPTPGA